MKLLEEYFEHGFNIAGAELLTDTEDEFSYTYITPDGKRLIVGWNRNVETFWRNKVNETADPMETDASKTD